MKSKFFAFTSAFLLFFFTSTFTFSSDLKESKVVVFVNNNAITRAELDMEINRLVPQELFHRNISPEKQKELEKKALDNLINTELFYIEAKRQGLKADNAEVKRTLILLRHSIPLQRHLRTP